jgi:hypothetical protein
MRLVICRYPGNDTTPWTRETSSSDLIFEKVEAPLPPPEPPPPPSIFYLPKANWSGTCSTGSEATVRAAEDYMPFWDGTVDPASANSTNMVFPPQDPAIPDVQVYIPGAIFLEKDVRYEGKGTIVIANQPQAIVYSSLLPQAGCALDFNSGDGDGPCESGTPKGYWIKSKVSPCLGSPGTDNPSSTFVSSDLAVLIVNGSAYSELNSTACDQEFDVVAIVGDRDASGSGPCFTEGVAGACFRILKKLQWYGVLMTRQFGLGQVPDFWQMPDLRLNLPGSVQNLFQSGVRTLRTERWREIF